MTRPALIACCLLTVLIGWGLSWEMLRFQTGGEGLPAATVAVFYRFVFAGVLFAAFVIIRDFWRGHRTYAWDARTWGWVALLGLGLFSTDYSLYYYGSIGMPPGLVALFFASLILTNLALTSLLLGHRPTRVPVISAFVGVGGVILVLWPSVFADGHLRADWFTLRQAGICFAGTLVVSFATLVQMRLNTPRVPVVTSTAFAMLFGATYVGLFSLMQGYSFDISGQPFSFFYTLAFLVGLGSIGAFSAYLKLVGLIGPNRGAYVNLATAVIALGVSYDMGSSGAWTGLQFVGVGLILIGYYFVLRFGAREPT